MDEPRLPRRRDIRCDQEKPVSVSARARLFADRLAPHSRRARVILMGDEIFTEVGGYVLGNFLT